MFSNIAIIKTDKYYYPKSDSFRPSVCYPEYLFKDDLALQENHVYDMVRECFFRLGYDSENYGSIDWNPLERFINPGDTVLLKPNLVMDNNPSGGGTDCLYTQPSVVAAVIDYVVIALKGEGHIILGDAPMQECKFDKLIHESGYDRLETFYKQKLPQSITFELVDFREVTSVVKNGMHYHTEEPGKGITIDLGNDSEHSDGNEYQYSNIRITNYDPSILQQHHNSMIHEYRINKKILESDVIINMPKPKTHRKAGVTIAMKNLVGINARKEYLPHHTNGSISEGGDEYKYKSVIKSLQNYFMDKVNVSSQGKNNYILTYFYHNIVRVLDFLRKKNKRDEYFEGSWYGNDTISKTIVDLNKILFYSNKKGQMCNEIQRKYLIIADMVISGEKEGPVLPTPKNVGIIAAGENPVCFDECIAKLMGAKLEMISTIKHARNPKGRFRFVENNLKGRIISNDISLNGKDIDQVTEKEILYFQPTNGWKEAFLYKD